MSPKWSLPFHPKIETTVLPKYGYLSGYTASFPETQVFKITAPRTSNLPLRISDQNSLCTAHFPMCATVSLSLLYFIISIIFFYYIIKLLLTQCFFFPPRTSSHLAKYILFSTCSLFCYEVQVSHSSSIPNAIPRTSAASNFVYYH